MPLLFSQDSVNDRKPNATDVLHRITAEPASLESGVSLLAALRVRGREAFVAWGFDTARRALALYVTSDIVREAELLEALSFLASAWAGAPGERGSRSSSLEIAGEQEGRVLAVGSASAEALPIRTLEAALGRWQLELWSWREDHGEIRFQRMDAAKGEADEEPGWEQPAPTPLTPEEIRSLIGDGFRTAGGMEGPG